MAELSIIIPFCNEYPQNIFTIQNIAQELLDRVDFEIIGVDNFCPEAAAQKIDLGMFPVAKNCPWCKTPLVLQRYPDNGGEAVRASQRGNPWLRYVKYDKKLSHWQAKNAGVAVSTGKFLWFCDAHCVISRDTLYNMFRYYRSEHERLNGSLHLPLSYKILEWHATQYKLVINKDAGEYHYSLTGYKHQDEPYEVPAASTCGMMITRGLYDALGGWPVELGIYGGGENFTNFTKAVIGKKKWIFTGFPMYHHGEKRGYNWNRDDYIRNRCIATYMFGGKPLAMKMIRGTKGRPEVLDKIYNDVITKCASHRAHIKQQQVTDIDSWAAKWQ